MVKQIVVASALVAGLTGTAMVLAGDLCMECHEPADDWQGLTPEEILAKAQDPDNDMHEDNKGLTEEQLKAMIASLMAK